MKTGCIWVELTGYGRLFLAVKPFFFLFKGVLLLLLLLVLVLVLLLLFSSRR